MKSLWCHALIVLFLFVIGSGGCVNRPLENVSKIPPCPTPNQEAINSLVRDEIPEPIVQYLIDIDIYCGMIDAFRE